MKHLKSKSPNCLLGSQKQGDFLNIMDSLFPDQDLLNESSAFRKKADFTFKLMINQKWTCEEFEKTMLEFSRKWHYNNWMPANLLDFRKKLFSDNEMVM